MRKLRLRCAAVTYVRRTSVPVRSSDLRTHFGRGYAEGFSAGDVLKPTLINRGRNWVFIL
jgi:hypothetical protein